MIDVRLRNKYPEIWDEVYDKIIIDLLSYMSDADIQDYRYGMEYCRIRMIAHDAACHACNALHKRKIKISKDQVSITTKRCSKCGKTKAMEEFSRCKSNNKDGRAYTCKRCHERYRLENLDRAREYRLQNYDKAKERVSKFRLENPDKVREYAKKYYIKNRDKIREYQKKYHIKNIDKIKEYQREYQRMYRENINESNSLHRD